MLTFREILGQDLVIANLRGSIAEGQIHHAYLFHGPVGVGKRTAALALGAALNCLSPEKDDGCGRCASCLRVANGNHPDFYQIMPEGKSIKINQIRELQAALGYKHWQGNYKIALIREADYLTEEAANSLLKILEEPPAKTCFVLLTSRPQSLLPTILSRCQQYGFRPVGVELLQTLLERKGVNQGKGKLLAHLSKGRPGVALAMFTDETFFQKRQKALDYCEALVKGGIKESFEVAEALNQDEWEVLFELMGNWWRDILVWQLSGTDKLLINLDLINKMDEGIPSLAGLKFALWELEKTRSRLRLNANRKLSLEVMALKINQEFALN